MTKNNAPTPRKEHREWVVVNGQPTAVRGRNITMEANLGNLLFVREGQMEIPNQILLRVRGTTPRRSHRGRNTGT